jgi:hypothetical protein
MVDHGKSGQIAAMQHKLSPALLSMVRSQRRALRKAKRGLTGADYERRRVALKGLTELEAHPLRPGLAVEVAKAVRRAVVA